MLATWSSYSAKRSRSRAMGRRPEETFPFIVEDLDAKTYGEMKAEIDAEIEVARAELRAKLNELHPIIRRLVLMLSRSVREALDDDLS